MVIKPDELDALDPEATRTIDIEDFVDLDGHRPDLLRPPVLPRARQGRGEGRTGCCSNAMEASGKVAIGRVVIRAKERLVAIRPAGELL